MTCRSSRHCRSPCKASSFLQGHLARARDWVAQKEFFQRAAALSGRTLSELVIDSTQEAAMKIIQDHEVIRLRREEQEAFVTALLTPTEPGRRLQEAVRSYRRKAGL